MGLGRTPPDGDFVTAGNGPRKRFRAPRRASAGRNPPALRPQRAGVETHHDSCSGSPDDCRTHRLAADVTHGTTPRLRSPPLLASRISRSTPAARVPKLVCSLSPTWPIRRKAPAAEALLSKLQAHAWKNDAERDELLRSIAALTDVAPEDLAWMAVESDPAVRQAGLALLKRLPWEASSPALFGYLSSKTEAVRRLAMVALETVAGGAFFERLPDLLSHNDPAVVHAALDHLKRNPNERALP